MPKLTHVVGTGRDKTAVYGRKDLKAKRKAADEAGIYMPVRKVTRAERKGK